MINKCACGSFYGGDSDKCSSCEKNKKLGKTFDITFYLDKTYVEIKKVEIGDCETIKDISSWINNVSAPWVCMGNRIINLDKINYADIEESK